MGDFRADIKVSFEILGKKYKHEFWINYWDDGDGNDERVKNWFSECYHDAKGRYHDHIDKELAEEENKNELSELERLKKKYE